MIRRAGAVLALALLAAAAAAPEEPPESVRPTAEAVLTSGAPPVPIVAQFATAEEKYCVYHPLLYIVCYPYPPKRTEAVAQTETWRNWQERITALADPALRDHRGRPDRAATVAAHSLL